MSAFVVSKEHINAMILAGLAVRYIPLGWYHNGEHHQLTSHNADEIGQMLLDENVASVAYRYQDDSLSQLPGKTNAEWLLPFEWHPFAKKPTALEAIKLVNCYEYQACEHPEWEQSEAKAFCKALRDNLIPQLPGYDKAPWEWTTSYK